MYRDSDELKKLKLQFEMSDNYWLEPDYGRENKQSDSKIVHDNLEIF